MAFIEANEIKLGAMLSNAQEAYKVPLYQREYSWSKDQWEDLYSDITELGEEDSHFLGSIVVVPDTGHRVGVNYFELVDGQQRLATVLILLSVMRDIARSRGTTGLADHIDGTYLFARDWRQGKEVRIPKLQLGRLDNEVFKSVLEAAPPRYSHLIFECYNFFKTKIESDNLDAIRDRLLARVSIVHINAFSYFNAFRLFETLNDRGLELSAADLIKNLLLMRVSGNEEVLNKVIEEWNEMYQKVREKQPVRFVRRYALASFKEEISEAKLYEGMKGRIEQEDWNRERVLEFVKDLNKKATLYKRVYEASFRSREINRMLKQLHLVEVGTSYTLLLRVLPLYEQGKLSDDDVLKIMRMIEIFHIRWGVCGQSTSRLNTIYNQMCSGLPMLSSSSEILESVKGAFHSEIRNNVADEIFRRSFSSRSFKPSETRTKYILWKLCSPTGETTIDVGEVQTEHIMPKTLSHQWVAYLKDKTGKEKDKIGALQRENLHKIGNLTIIKGEWNVRMSNRLFDDKKEDYERSEFLVTNGLASYDKWTFEEIQGRCKELSDLAVRIWKWE